MPKGLRRAAIYILVIAGFAALTSGSCIHLTYGGVDRSNYGNGIAQTANAAGLSAVVASSIAAVFLFAWYSRGRLTILTGTSVAAYAAVLQVPYWSYLTLLLAVFWDGIFLLACCVLLVFGVFALRSNPREALGAILMIVVSLLGGLAGIGSMLASSGSLVVAGLGAGIFLIACSMLFAMAMTGRRSGSRGAQLAKVINALPALGFLAVINPMLEDTGEIFGFFRHVALMLVCWMLFVVVVTAQRSGFRRALGAMVISGLAALGGFGAIFIGVMTNYGICIGFFGTSCPEPEPMDIFPFALIAGGAPPVLAAVAARLVGDWYRPPRDVDGT